MCYTHHTGTRSDTRPAAHAPDARGKTSGAQASHDIQIVDPPPHQVAEAEKLRKQMRKVEDERVLEKKKQEEERRKHEEALKKAKEEVKIRKKESDEKAKEMEREIKAVRAEAEELRKQMDVAKTEARDAKAVARSEKRNRKKRERRELTGDSSGQVDQPDLGSGEQEGRPGYPQWSRPVPPGPPASHVHPPWPGIGGKRSLAAMMYFDQVDRERNAEYERGNREREQERATRERAAEASRTRALQMMMMGNSYF
jgi:hypothetical protein